jgi:hypothetical protein
LPRSCVCASADRGWFTYRVAEDVIKLLGALFADLNVRSRGGVVWTASARHLPLEVEVTPADCNTRSFPLRGAVVADGVVQFAQQVQQWLIGQLSDPVPPCPTHGFALDPRLVGRFPRWACAQGDFDCEFGRYLLALWPPAAYDPEAAPMLAARLQDRGIRFTKVGLAERGSTPIAQVTLLPGEDEASVRAALGPFRVEISSAEPVWTERFTSRRRKARSADCGYVVVERSGWLRSPADWSDPAATRTLTSLSTASRSDSAPNIGLADLTSRCYLTRMAFRWQTSARSPTASAAFRQPRVSEVKSVRSAHGRYT